MANDDDLFDVKYVPPPAPEPGKFIVRPKVQGQYPTLHLSPNEAFALWTALGNCMEDEIDKAEMERLRRSDG